MKREAHFHQEYLYNKQLIECILVLSKVTLRDLNNLVISSNSAVLIMMDQRSNTMRYFCVLPESNVNSKTAKECHQLKFPFYFCCLKR